MVAEEDSEAVGVSSDVCHEHRRRKWQTTYHSLPPCPASITHSSHWGMSLLIFRLWSGALDSSPGSAIDFPCDV